MERFASMLNKLGLRGSSDDDRLEKNRSAQSTPRMKRHLLVQNGSNDSRRSFGSMGSMEGHRTRVQDRSWDSDQRHLLNRSWDCERVLGLDRAWEQERVKGMELLYQSMERRERGRSKHRKRKHRDKTRSKEREKLRASDHEKLRVSDREREERRSKSRETVDRIEKLEMNNYQGVPHEYRWQFVEEKPPSHRHKLSMARRQREMARQQHRGDHAMRESLMRELDRERMLRVDAEQRLREMTIESDNCKQRLLALQDEFKKMEQMVQSLMQYKSKIDQLRQDKVSMTISYENTAEKYRTHISDLEQENSLLLSEVKKLESQCNKCHLCNKDLSVRVSKTDGEKEDVDKSKVLLERIRKLEAQNSALVLENETQRQQYEKCLDEIANQVVTALLTQKSLREECGKLQTRVIDLETHNRHLGHMFQHRITMATDSTLQTLASKTLLHKTLMDVKSAKVTDGEAASAVQHPADGSTVSLAVVPSMLYVPGQERSASVCSGSSFESLHSLHSICSDYNDQSCTHEEYLGKPQMSSPPPWLRDRLQFPFSSPANSDRTSSPLSFDFGRLSPHLELCSSAENAASQESAGEEVKKLESQPANVSTEHAQDALPVEHAQASLPVEEVKNKLSSSAEQNLTSPIDIQTECKLEENDCKQSDKKTDLNKIETEFPANNSSPKMVHVGLIYHKTDIGATQLRVSTTCKKNTTSSSNSSSGGPCRVGVTSGNMETSAVGASAARTQHITISPKEGKDISPGQELLKLSDSFTEKYMVNVKDGLPHIRNNGTVYSDSSDSDDSAGSRPLSKDYSVASTVSLNEILERELDEMETPLDEEFSVAHFNVIDLEPVQTQVVMGSGRVDSEPKSSKSGSLSILDDSDSDDDLDDELLNSVISHAMSFSSKKKPSSPQKQERNSQKEVSPPGDELDDLVPPGEEILDVVVPPSEQVEPFVSEAESETESGEYDIKTQNDENIFINGFGASDKIQTEKSDIQVEDKAATQVRKVSLQRPNSLELPRKNLDLNRCNGYSSSDSEINEGSPTPTNCAQNSNKVTQLSSNSPSKLLTGQTVIEEPDVKLKEKCSNSDESKSDDVVVYNVQSPRSQIFELFAKANTSVLNNKGEFDPEALQRLELSNKMEIVNIKIHPQCGPSTASEGREALTGYKGMVRICADVMTSSSGSSCSPDSAMQHSFSSSSSSDHSLADRPSCKDDGYASNSTVSISDLHHEITPRSEGQPEVTPKLEEYTGALGWDVAESDVTCENSILDFSSIENSALSEIPVNFCRQDSISSAASNTSIENSSIGRVRDIKAFFEGQKGEKKKKVPPPVPPKKSQSKFKPCKVPIEVHPRTPDRDEEADMLLPPGVECEVPPSLPSGVNSEMQTSLPPGVHSQIQTCLPPAVNSEILTSLPPGVENTKLDQTVKGKEKADAKAKSPMSKLPKKTNKVPNDVKSPLVEKDKTSSIPFLKKSLFSRKKDLNKSKSTKTDNVILMRAHSSDTESVSSSPKVEKVKGDTVMCVSDSCIFTPKYIKAQKLGSLQSSAKLSAQEDYGKNSYHRSSSETAVEKYSKSKKDETLRKIKETLLHDWRKLKPKSANQKKDNASPQNSLERGCSLLPRRSQKKQTFYRSVSDEEKKPQAKQNGERKVENKNGHVEPANRKEVECGYMALWEGREAPSGVLPEWDPERTSHMLQESFKPVATKPQESTSASLKKHQPKCLPVDLQPLTSSLQPLTSDPAVDPTPSRQQNGPIKSALSELPKQSVRNVGVKTIGDSSNGVNDQGETSKSSSVVCDNGQSKPSPEKHSSPVRVQMVHFPVKSSKTCAKKNGRKSEDFSHQIENLTKTVNELQASLSSLDSVGLDSEEESHKKDHGGGGKKRTSPRKQGSMIVEGQTVLPPSGQERNTTDRTSESKPRVQGYVYDHIPMYGQEIGHLSIVSSHQEYFSAEHSTSISSSLDLSRYFIPIDDTERHESVSGQLLDEQSSLFSFSDEDYGCHGNLCSSCYGDDCSHGNNNTVYSGSGCHGEEKCMHCLQRFRGFYSDGGIISPIATTEDGLSNKDGCSNKDTSVFAESIEGASSDPDLVMANKISLMDAAMAEDMMKFLRLHPPQNRTVAALQGEGRQVKANRYSYASFDSHYSFGIDGLSFSDSCCESFSSSADDD